MKNIFAFLAALALLVSPAAAGDGPRFTGCYVGMVGSASVVHNPTSVEAVGFPAGINFDGLSASGLGIGGVAGCDVTIAKFDSTALVVGGWGDFLFKDLEHSARINLGADSAGAKFGLENAWTIGGRVGMMLNHSTLLYVLGGYTQAETSDLTADVNGTTIGKVGLPTLHGYTAGGGIDIKITNNLVAGLQYRYVKYEGETVELAPGVANFKIEPEEHIGLLSLKYRIGN